MHLVVADPMRIRLSRDLATAVGEGVSWDFVGSYRPDVLAEVLAGADVYVGSKLPAVAAVDASALRLVQVAGAGFEGIDRSGLRPGAVVANTTHHGQAIAEYCVKAVADSTARGIPLMRPLFLAYLDQAPSWEVDDEFLFGPDILAVPILDYQARTCEVWLPGDETWLDPWTGQKYKGGQLVTIDVPLQRAAFFLRSGSPMIAAVAEVVP
nr:hypothetical protein GCM10020063_001550 [Dactylosporangium thailandense]